MMNPSKLEGGGPPAMTIPTTMIGNECLTKVDLGFDRRVLRVETGKATRGIACSASVVQMSPDGRTFSCVLFQDYRKTLVRDVNARATAKAVRTMHDAGLALLDTVIAEVREQYKPDAPKIEVGTRIHYSGDVCNSPGWFTVTEIMDTGIGPCARLKEDDGERDMSAVTIAHIGHVYHGHCSPRFVTQAAYDAYRAARSQEATA